MSARRDLADLATRIVLRLFNPNNSSEPKEFADRLVLAKNSGVDLGGWALGPARDTILAELRRRPRNGRRRIKR